MVAVPSMSAVCVRIPDLRLGMFRLYPFLAVVVSQAGSWLL